jgi:hypothetical protein
MKMMVELEGMGGRSKVGIERIFVSSNGYRNWFQGS